ncbi:MAG: hypothetical protein IPI11_17720 [Haliscomenobacter sp.]|nr:hypothetical protein [Haliscomenobacter sp.]
MPGLAGVLLIAVYLVSAIAGGMFLSTLLATIKGGTALAFSIGAAIQFTRATLVFFPQLNPSRPVFGYTGEAIAVIMGVVSIGEILSLVDASGLPYPVAVSLSILMLAGIGIEIFLLREIRFATEVSLYGNRQWWDELQQFYRARESFRQELETLRNQAAGIQSPAIPHNSHQPVNADQLAALVDAKVKAALTGQQPQAPGKSQAPEQVLEGIPLDFSSNGHNKPHP